MAECYQIYVLVLYFWKIISRPICPCSAFRVKGFSSCLTSDPSCKRKRKLGLKVPL